MQQNIVESHRLREEQSVISVSKPFIENGILCRASIIVCEGVLKKEVSHSPLAILNLLSFVKRQIILGCVGQSSIIVTVSITKKVTA